jgi:hypothetical protein
LIRESVIISIKGDLLLENILYYRIDHPDFIEDVVKIRSVEELRKVYEKIQPQNIDGVYEKLFFNHEKYNDAFFTECFLIFIIIYEGSGSVRHKVTSLTKEDGILLVSIEKKLPEIGTADMAGWLIVVEADNAFVEFDVLKEISEENYA